MAIAADRRATIARLRGELRKCERIESGSREDVTVLGPLGLLGASLRPGCLVEFVGHEPGGLTLAALLVAETAGRVILIDPKETVSPAALRLCGFDLSRLLVVRPADERLALWAAEQALRCKGVATTVCRFGPRLGTTVARRLKLASEAGGGFGLAVRAVAREPPFGDVRLAVRPLPSEGTETLRPRWEVESVYVRGGREGERCVVEVTTDARLVPAPSELARATGPGRRIGG
jgi:protein ImuA